MNTDETDTNSRANPAQSGDELRNEQSRLEQLGRKVTELRKSEETQDVDLKIALHEHAKSNEPFKTLLAKLEETREAARTRQTEWEKAREQLERGMHSLIDRAVDKLLAGFAAAPGLPEIQVEGSPRDVDKLTSLLSFKLNPDITMRGTRAVLMAITKTLAELGIKHPLDGRIRDVSTVNFSPAPEALAAIAEMDSEKLGQKMLYNFKTISQELEEQRNWPIEKQIYMSAIANNDTDAAIAAADRMLSARLDQRFKEAEEKFRPEVEAKLKMLATTKQKFIDGFAAVPGLDVTVETEAPGSGKHLTDTNLIVSTNDGDIKMAISIDSKVNTRPVQLLTATKQALNKLGVPNSEGDRWYIEHGVINSILTPGTAGAIATMDSAAFAKDVFHHLDQMSKGALDVSNLPVMESSERNAADEFQPSHRRAR